MPDESAHIEAGAWLRSLLADKDRQINDLQLQLEIFSQDKTPLVLSQRELQLLHKLLLRFQQSTHAPNLPDFGAVLITIAVVATALRDCNGLQIHEHDSL